MTNQSKVDVSSLTAAMDASHPLWDPKWDEGRGEETIRLHSSSESEEKPSQIIVYCSWFCPFAQRAWIAAEELDIPYEYVECNPYRVDPEEAGGYTKKSLSLAEKKALLPEFMRTSPRGLVPAIRNVEGGECIWESAVVLEYLDQVYGQRRLYTSVAEGQAHVRIYVDHCTSRIQKAYYALLMQSSPEGQIKAKIEFFRECRALACAMAPSGDEPSPGAILEATQRALEEETADMQRVDVEALSLISQESFARRSKLDPGPFFLGAQFSGVDIALAPFWQRVLWVGGRYRGLELPTDAAFRRLDQWWQVVSRRPSVARTFVGKERLISSYRHYASNAATSDLANSMKSSLSGGEKSQK